MIKLILLLIAAFILLAFFAAWYVLRDNKTKWDGKMYVTLGYDFHPTKTDDGKVLMRDAENILRKQYYPTGEKGEWPCDPLTGEKLPIAPR